MTAMWLYCPCRQSHISTSVMALDGEGNGTSLQYSCLENPMDRGAWWAAVHGVARSRTRLSDFTFTFHFHASEKEIATHSSVLAWRIPGTGEPGGLPSMGSHRVGHDWSDLAAMALDGEGNGTPLQYSCLENHIDRGAWWAAVHGVAKSQTRLSDFTFMHWRRKWQPIPVFLPGESQGWGRLVGCCLWGRTESDTTEAT